VFAVLVLHRQIAGSLPQAKGAIANITREFADDHRSQQCISLGTGVPGHYFIGFVRDLPAHSHGFLMVITQEPTQPVATLHRSTPTSFRDPRKQQGAGLPLMIPLGMVRRNIFAQRSP
jgi:hypothetical protein